MKAFPRLSPVAWYDASDLSTITESGGFVSSLADKSGNGKHMVQAVGANQPTTGTQTQNSLNVLDFNGDDFLLASNLVFSPEGDQLVIAVATIDTPKNFAGLLAFDDGAGEDWELYNSSNIQEDLRFFNELPPNAANIADNPHTGYNLFGVETNQTALEKYVYVNSEVKLTQPYTGGVFSNTNTLALAANRDSHGVNLDCKIAEVIVTDDLSTVTRNKVEGYLAHKWGLTANLPGGHPYKTTPPTI